VQPVSPALLAEEPLAGPHPNTDRFRLHQETTPLAVRPAAPGSPSPADDVPTGPGRALPDLAATASDIFRGLEKGLMEVDFAGKVFIKQGTIYSYSGNLTFWVKEKRPGGRPALVIVTGTGRLILTDKDREITFMQVADEPVYVEPMHLLACEEALQPRYVRLGDDAAPVEVIALEGRGMVALSVAGKPLPLTVRPAQPVSVPAASVIMWTGSLTPHVVEDPEVYAVVLASTGAGGARLLRLEGTGRILVEQMT
jgi:uncharacterized protein (AIM24 family)